MLDVLRLALDRLGVEEKCGCIVKSVSKRGKYSIAKETLVTGIFTAHEKGY